MRFHSCIDHELSRYLYRSQCLSLNIWIKTSTVWINIAEATSKKMLCELTWVSTYYTLNPLGRGSATTQLLQFSGTFAVITLYSFIFVLYVLSYCGHIACLPLSSLEWTKILILCNFKLAPDLKNCTILFIYLTLSLQINCNKQATKLHFTILHNVTHPHLLQRSVCQAASEASKTEHLKLTQNLPVTGNILLNTSIWLL